MAGLRVKEVELELEIFLDGNFHAECNEMNRMRISCFVTRLYLCKIEISAYDRGR